MRHIFRTSRPTNLKLGTRMGAKSNRYTFKFQFSCLYERVDFLWKFFFILANVEQITDVYKRVFPNTDKRLQTFITSLVIVVIVVVRVCTARWRQCGRCVVTWWYVNVRSTGRRDWSEVRPTSWDVSWGVYDSQRAADRLHWTRQSALPLH